MRRPNRESQDGLGHDSGTESSSDDEDAPHLFLEQHRWYDLDEDGYKEPYIVTVHKDTEKVVRIATRFDEEASPDKSKILSIKPVNTSQNTLIPSRWRVLRFRMGIVARPDQRAANSTINQLPIPEPYRTCSPVSRSWHPRSWWKHFVPIGRVEDGRFDRG